MMTTMTSSLRVGSRCVDQLVVVVVAVVVREGRMLVVFDSHHMTPLACGCGIWALVAVSVWASLKARAVSWPGF